MNEREALAFALGLLEGLRDDTRNSREWREMCRAAVKGLLPRASELGYDIDKDAWEVMERA